MIGAAVPRPSMIDLAAESQRSRDLARRNAMRDLRASAILSQIAALARKAEALVEEARADRDG